MYVIKVGKMYVESWDGDSVTLVRSQLRANKGAKFDSDLDGLDLAAFGGRFVKLKPKAQPTGLQGTAPGHELD